MTGSKWLAALPFLVAAMPAQGDSYVGIDYCGPASVCFNPTTLTINAGDRVTFLHDNEFRQLFPSLIWPLHNVVADDGSFRCALGCDGEGGNGSPGFEVYFTRTFPNPGVFSYHDEVSGAAGVIVVGPAVVAPVEPVEPPKPFAIGPGMTGTWVDAQSGHGWIIQVLPENRILAASMTFNASGTQAWFLGVGTYGGKAATIASAEQPSGGRWIPNFDPGRVAHKAWGTLVFTFTDCNHGRVDFSSPVAGFGSGSMELRRLTQPLGLACPGST